MPIRPRTISPGPRRIGAAALIVACVALAAGCGGDDPDVSPVSGEERFEIEAGGLAPLLVTSRQPAVPFKGSNGRFIAAYELQLFNATPLTLTPTRVEILDPDGAVIETLSADEVAAALALPSVRSDVEELGEGQLGTLYLNPEFNDLGDVPDVLEHEITVEADGLPPGGVTSAPAPVDVNKELRVPVVGPPVAADSCCGSIRHRRALLPIDNGQFLSQRLAVDWEQLDVSGRTVREGGDRSDAADYTIYGKQAIAATDGTVVTVIDDLPEQVPGALPDSITLPEADGNSVIVDIGNGLFMAYAHMQAGSIEVEVGDGVKRGDAIGLIGNSGNTSAPHLHFHVMDGPSALGSEGVPYVIESFETTGKIPSTEVFDSLENTDEEIPVVPSESDGSNVDELPLDQTIVTFR